MRMDSRISAKLTGLLPHLDERARRMVVAAEAMALPRGGVSLVHRCCGMSRVTILKGIRELRQGVRLPEGRQRRAGGGRKRFAAHHPGFAQALDHLVEPDVRGDPESPLRWSCKSTRKLAAELGKPYGSVSHETVAKALREAHYSLQGNRKTQEGNQHEDRDAQFRHINATVTTELRHGRPVISVDTKKKELIGNYANKGQQWRARGRPRHVNGHDFP